MRLARGIQRYHATSRLLLINAARRSSSTMRVPDGLPLPLAVRQQLRPPTTAAAAVTTHGARGSGHRGLALRGDGPAGDAEVDDL